VRHEAVLLRVRERPRELLRRDVDAACCDAVGGSQ